MTMEPARHRILRFALLTALLPVGAPFALAADVTPAPPASEKTATKIAAPLDSSTEEVFEKKRFSLNVKGAEVREVLRMIAERGSLELKLQSSITGKIRLSLQDVTLGEALDRIAEDQGLDYLIEGDRLAIKHASRHSIARRTSRTPAESSTGASSSAGLTSSVSNSGSVREIPIQFKLASQILDQLKSLTEKEDLVMVDELSNSILFQGDEENYQKILEFIRILDRLPQQVLIEAQVVETSRSFLQAYGLAWGNDSGNPDQAVAFKTAASGPKGNAELRLNVGNLAGGKLEVALSAAESNGDARVISRPKVVTLNNTAATINSGVSFYIKTLSSTVTGGSEGGLSAATGGVSQLTSGLQLSVTPTIMGKDLIKLLININNSTPDEAQAVDGIPGILNNSAKTSVIVSEGRTAVIAGLVKNTGGKSSAGVPFFQNIPILGALFRNSTFSDRNNELVMFITPQIVTPQLDLKPTKSFGEPKITAPATEGAASGM
jgi:type IV pilus assembly protein PilQ